MVAGSVTRSLFKVRARYRADSIFHLALADTAPDAWGRRVIARPHAKERKNNPNLAALTELGAPGAALQVLSEVMAAFSNWKALAMSPEAGLTRKELDDFAPAFEHEAAQAARNALAG
ncbi:MAG: hypothetical protein PHQ58_20835 [Rhodoferax sp.]|uniref:hypothetical protein n=1 Tax=Rhodoferax sp. TaxID=50421 RepID=UPI0026150278|nr:hypothetical protein [Rhodoferax sp.]MDD2882865.1 hypothetical protein [Rhodoferax sp.]